MIIFKNQIMKKLLFIFTLVPALVYPESLDLILTCEGKNSVSVKQKNESIDNYVNLVNNENDIQTFEFKNGFYIMDSFPIEAEASRNLIEVKLNYNTDRDDLVSGWIKINRISGEIFSIKLLTPKSDDEMMISSSFDGICKKSNRQF